MTTHSKAPWHADVIPNITGAVSIRRTDGSLIAMVRSTEDVQANAYLMAAAPELYEACKAALQSLDCIDRKALQWALDKAQGKET